MSLDPRQPSVTGPADPEHDPAASYALEPSAVKALTDRIVSTTGRSEPTYTPITGQPLAQVPQSSEADVEEAFARARRAQRAWAQTSLEDRAARLLRLHDLVLDRQDEIIDLICWETGKARKHAFDEPLHVALTARYYGRTAREHLDTTRRIGVIPALTRVEVNHVPKGVVGIISPWNYPFNLALIDGIAALLAGNAVVTKPDAQTMLSALIGARLLEEAGIPRDLWQVVAGPGSEIGPAVVARADYVCFTGSTATGRLIAQGCAERLVGCSLELGGKNPVLVLRDADLERAAEGAVRACFSNAGQLCVSMERMYVADQVYDRFVDRFVARTQAMSLGTSLAWGSDMGSLTSQQQLDAVTAHVADAVAKGATVLTGGRAPARPRPVLLRAHDPRGRHPRHDLLRQGDLRPGGVRLPLPRRGRRDQPRQRGAVRPQRQHLVTRHEACSRGRPADPVRQRQRQRGVRRQLRQRRLADGRVPAVRPRPAPGQRGRAAVHRVAVGRGAEGDPAGADAGHVRSRRTRR